MAGDRLLADEKRVGDLSVGLAERNERENLDLASGEATGQFPLFSGCG